MKARAMSGRRICRGTRERQCSLLGSEGRGFAPRALHFKRFQQRDRPRRLALVTESVFMLRGDMVDTEIPAVL